MSYDAASTLFVTYPTSYAALVLRAKLQKNEWCLVHAAAGGVGLCAVQIAKALGARVIATAGSPEKLEVARKHGGADHVLDYRKEGWQKEVLKITGGKGADVIYDPVGMIQPSLKCIAWNGRALVVGFAAGAIEKVSHVMCHGSATAANESIHDLQCSSIQIPMNLVLLKNISIVGIHWGAYSKNERERIPEVWAALLQLVREGQLRPVIFEKIYKGLESLPEGLKALGSRGTWGKAVLRIKDDDSQAGSRSAKL